MCRYAVSFGSYQGKCVREEFEFVPHIVKQDWYALVRCYGRAFSPLLPPISLMKQSTDGGALNVHDSSSVVFLGDLVLEHIEVEGSGGGMYITNDVSRIFPGVLLLKVFVLALVNHVTFSSRYVFLTFASCARFECPTPHRTCTPRRYSTPRRPSPSGAVSLLPPGRCCCCCCCV